MIGNKIDKKSAKKIKSVSAKKLPSIFKKEYTVDSYEKKIGKHIFIEADKDFVKKIFVSSADKKGRPIFKVDFSSQISKNDLKRYKILSKQIKNQKGGIKIVPFVAVAVFIAAAGISFSLFKNVIVKNIIVSSMQGIFKAKTDISKVDFRFFNSYLNIKGLAQANKDSPMKNIFQADDIMIDFDLADLCKGKFHAENIIVEGVAINTDRKVSGKIALKEKKTKQKSEESDISKKSEELKNSVSEHFMAMFQNYNPERILADLQEQLESPKIADDISAGIQEKITKWQDTPAKIQAEITEFSSSVNDILKTDWTKIKDGEKLKSALESLNNAYITGNALKETVEKNSGEIKTDSVQIAAYAKQIEKAVVSDLNLVETKIGEAKKLFSIQGFSEVMSQAVQSVLYSAAGKYYPYANTAMKKALEIKNDSSGKSGGSAKKQKPKKSGKNQKKSKERLKGRDFYFVSDGIPKILLNNVVASGYEYGKEQNAETLIFKCVATDISSDQNVYGKPAKLEADFKIFGDNKASVTVDARTNSESPLVIADYSGKNYPFSADAQIFSFNSKADISAKLSADSEGSFKISGSLNISMDGIDGMAFEPARLSELYGKALKGIKKLPIGFSVDFSKENGVSVSIENLDSLSRQLAKPVTAAIFGELDSISANARENASKMLLEKTGIATEKIDKFLDIQNLIGKEKAGIDSLQKQLDSKKKEIQNQIANAAKNAAVDAASSAIKNATNGFKLPF